MVNKLVLAAVSAALLASVSTVAGAADLIDPPVVDLPEPTTIIEDKHGGWYLRGDVGYSLLQMSDVDYVTAGGGVVGFGLLRGELDSSYTIGGGVGYDTGHYARFDFTADYLFDTDYLGSSTGTCTAVGTGLPVACTTTDTATLNILSLMANAYVDIGTFGSITPYVGVGIGGSHLRWGTLTNNFDNTLVTNADETHAGGADWRFTYAAMAGASIDVTDCVAVDAGYRYRSIEGGRMFGVGTAGTTGPGYDNGIVTHDFKLGARYKFGGHGGGCGGHVTPEYEPIDYKPIYK